MKKVFIVILLLFIVPVSTAVGTIGVGVGTGKIVVDEKLKPGQIYTLPSLNVINTGDTPSDYEIAVSYHEKQTELKPSKNWFIFSPSHFYLNPNEIKNVDLKLNLPIQMQPGTYFAYIEAHPVKKSKTTETTIGIAAASKLYFTVVEANPVQGLFYKLLSFWKTYSPWTQIAALLAALLIIFSNIKKYFHIQIKRKDKK